MFMMSESDLSTSLDLSTLLLQDMLRYHEARYDNHALIILEKLKQILLSVALREVDCSHSLELLCLDDVLHLTQFSLHEELTLVGNFFAVLKIDRSLDGISTRIFLQEPDIAKSFAFLSLGVDRYFCTLDFPLLAEDVVQIFTGKRLI